MGPGRHLAPKPPLHPSRKRGCQLSEAGTKRLLRQIGSDKEGQRRVDSRGISYRKKLRLIEAIDFLKHEKFVGILGETNEPLCADDFLRQVSQQLGKGLLRDALRQRYFQRGEVMLGMVMVVVFRVLLIVVVTARLARLQPTLSGRGQLFAKSSKLGGKFLRADPPSAEVMVSKRLFDLSDPRRLDGIRPRNEEVRSRASLLTLQGVVPEPLLPSLGIDHRKLHRQRKASQVFFQGKDFYQLLAVRRAVGLHEHDAPRNVLERFQGGHQFLA